MKTILKVFCVAWLLPSALLAENSQEQLQRAVLAGDADAIIELADSASETDAHYVPAQLAKAVVLSEKQRYDESIAAYSKAIDAAPEDAVEAYMGRSMVKRKKGDQKGADADAEKAKKLRAKGKSLYLHQLNQRVAARPEDADALLARALDKLNAKAYEDAIRDFDAYIVSVAHCDNSMVYASKAYAQEMLGDVEGAMATCTDWLAVLPSSAKAYQLRARLRHTAGDEQGSARDMLAYQSVVRETKRKALTDIGKAIEKNPNLTFGYYERAKLYMELGQYQEAEADLDKAGELDPEAKQLKRLRKNLKMKKQDLLRKQKEPSPSPRFALSDISH
jgi:tetratricopeptide (TPR) repeat protein